MAQPTAQFRETLWFKRGDLAEHARPEAADAEANAEVPRAALLPVEDRYLDDGTITPADRTTFGLHTGTTAYVPRVREAAPPDDTTADDDGVLPRLVAEMKRARRRVIAAIGVVAVAGTALVMSVL